MPDEREVELPFLRRYCTQFPALDVGCAESRYLEDLGGDVDGIDLREPMFGTVRRFFQADIRTWVSDEQYPTVIALSTIEHIGLECESYGTVADEDAGDVVAMRACWDLVAPGGCLILTVPFGAPEHRGWYRRYGFHGLANLVVPGTVEYAEIHTHPEWKVGGVFMAVLRKPL